MQIPRQVAQLPQEWQPWAEFAFPRLSDMYTIGNQRYTGCNEPQQKRSVLNNMSTVLGRNCPENTRIKQSEQNHIRQSSQVKLRCTTLWKITNPFKNNHITIIRARVTINNHRHDDKTSRTFAYTLYNPQGHQMLAWMISLPTFSLLG